MTTEATTLTTPPPAAQRTRHYNDEGERLYPLTTGEWLTWEALVDFLYAQPELAAAAAQEHEAHAAYDAAAAAFCTGRDALNRYEIGYDEYHRLWTVKDARFALFEQARTHRVGVWVWQRGVHVLEVD